MDTSLFLAQAFGLYFTIAGAALLLQPVLLRSLTNKFAADRESIVFGGFLTLLVGIPLVLIHNVWDGSWAVIITVIVWIIFIKGAVRMLLPDMVLDWSRSLMNKHSLLQLAVLAMVVLGIYLLFIGFNVTV